MKEGKLEIPDISELKEIEFEDEYILISPVNFEGQEITKVHYNFNRLKGSDIFNIRSQAKALRSGGTNQMQPDMMTDDLFQAILFAYAADQPGKIVLELGAADLIAWIQVSSMWLGLGLLHLMQKSPASS